MEDDTVWQFRGYQMRPGEFNTALVHFYRGELSRSNTWRIRLDTTTNWAVVTMGGLMTFAFSSVNNSHVIILIGLLLICLFLMMEARRYRYYELWAMRVRLIETDFFAAMLSPTFNPNETWAVRLANSLITPEFTISYLEAVGRRLRRNYMWLFLVLWLAWCFKLLIHPIQAHTWDSFFGHANIGGLSGYIVFPLVTLLILGMLTLSILTSRLQKSAGEVLVSPEMYGASFLNGLADAASQVLPTEFSFSHKNELLTIIITDKADAISQRLMSLLQQGVTALQGTGMYTKQPRSVLLCVVKTNQIEQLKNLVYAADEHAFIVVNPTNQILGGQFDPLGPQWRKN